MKPQNNIALYCIILAVVLMVFLFAESRNDPSLRIAALVAGTGLVSTLAAIASTILTGKDLSRHDASDLPPGTTLKETTSSAVETHTPPPDPNAL